MTAYPRSFFENDYSLVLPFSGANGGTDFTDRSPRPSTFTRSGSVSTVTSTYRHYGSSGFFGGSGWLQSPYSSDFDLSTQDFTLDCWFNRLSNTGSAIYGCLISKRVGGADWDWGIETNSGQSVVFKWGDASDGSRSLNMGNAPLGEWNHCAVVRRGSALLSFMNGVPVSSATISGSIRNRNTAAIMVGRSLTTYFDNTFHGYMNDLRLLRGHAAFFAQFDTSNVPPAWDGALTTFHSEKIIRSQVVDLYGTATPRVVVFDWDAPANHRPAVIEAAGRWMVFAHPPIRFGIYYLSRDARNHPIVHGPYTRDNIPEYLP